MASKRNQWRQDLAARSATTLPFKFQEFFYCYLAFTNNQWSGKQSFCHYSFAYDSIWRNSLGPIGPPLHSQIQNKNNQHNGK